MAKLDSIHKAAKKPFGDPAAGDNGRFQILIPEGAETGVIPDGPYNGKCSGLLKNVSQGGKGNPQWVFNFTIVKGKYRGMDFDLYCPLIPNSMWKLADTLTALGVKKGPKGEVDFDRSEVLNVLVILNIRKQAGTGGYRDQSKVMGVLPHPDGAGTKSKGSTFVVPGTPEEEEEEPEAEYEDVNEEEETDGEDTKAEDGEGEEGSEEGEDDEEDFDPEENEEEEWDAAKEREEFDRQRAARRSVASQRHALKKQPEDDVKPVRRVGPKTIETPVTKAKKSPRR